MESKLSVEQRANELLSKMTLDDKINQLHIYFEIDKVFEEIENGNKIQLRCGTFGAPKNAETINKIQDYCLNMTRLGIPMLAAFESLHGLLHHKATVFPQCAGLGGSFDKDMIYKMADIIGREARDIGIRQVYAPNVDIPRDPRWGRMQECYGEDPYLVGEMGAEYVKGIQNHQVAATAKHFVAYGVPEAGVNLTPAHIGEREIREVMLEPFQKCIDAGVMAVMPSYNEIDGVPVHASEFLINDLLRNEMGFDGVVISDYSAILLLQTFHHITSNPKDTGKLAIQAGIDIEAPEIYGYGEQFKEAIRNGEIDESLINNAVLNVLKLKIKLGLFEDPYTKTEDASQTHLPDAVSLSKEMDECSILLLENDGILPLDEESVGRVAVIGNNAKESFLGDYIDFTEYCVSFYDGLVNRLGKENVLYAQGCNPIIKNDEMLEEAIEIAKAADTIFLVLGDCGAVGGGINCGDESIKLESTCGEGYDTHDLNFTPSQQCLFDEIIKLGKSVILVVYAGRPYTIKKEVSKVNAFMFSWGGGEQSGNAMASLIFGDKSPSAKLSISFPQSVGHIPCYYNYKVSSRGALYKKPGSYNKPGRDYVLASTDAWYPFGYGLSYTKLNYSNLSAENINGTVYVSVDVENIGSYDINESVLLYVKALTCPITPFVKKLRAFKKVDLKIGQKKTVNFTLTSNDFTYIDLNMKTAINRGLHKILIENLECEIII